MKHTLFPLCIKRKTGPKEMVQWVNRFDHGMSYKEVYYLETTLALGKSFCPSIIQPSSFMTYIALTHFSQYQYLLDHTLARNDSILFPIQTLRIETEHKTMESGKKGKFLMGAIEVPGFNYQTSPDGDNSYHNVAYLPAIDKSQTQINTVYELLNQSMMKTSALGHDEADIVVDQTIYAKAVEILMNPINIDNKRFIIIRMGAFYTSCIFLSVIDKRVGDGGLQ